MLIFKLILAWDLLYQFSESKSFERTKEKGQFYFLAFRQCSHQVQNIKSFPQSFCQIRFFFLIFSVLYFSWHRYEHQKFWPSLKESDYDAVGLGKGKGFNINLPWNKVSIVYSTTKQVQ